MKRRFVSLVLVGGLLLLFFYQPLTSDGDLTEEIETTYKTLLKYRAVALDGKGSGEKEAEQELRDLEKGLLPGPSVARAVARLQTVIGDLAREAGLSITSVRPLSPVDRSPYQEIAIQVSLDGTLVQLRDFLRATEGAATLLRVVNLNVRVNNVRAPDTLRIKVAIAGIMKV